MKLAHLAGISTFVTGGSGGVHRGGEDSMDVSADLTELARTPVVVVSAGIKSILDISVSSLVSTVLVPYVMAYLVVLVPHAVIVAPRCWQACLVLWTLLLTRSVLSRAFYHV